MPKLPDKQSLGERALPGGGRQFVNIRPDQIGRSVEGFGNQLNQTGAKLEEREDSLNFARAKSYFMREKLKLESELDTDQDYQKWDSKYAQRLTQIQGEAAKMISRNRDREAFTLETGVDFERGVSAVRDRQRGRLREVGIADLENTTAANLDAALLAPDETTAKALLKSTAEGWDGAVQRGWLPAQAVAQKKREILQTYAVSYVQSRPLEEQRRLLGGGASTASGSYYDKVVKPESGGNNMAVNPDTNATGPVQFIDDTWLAQIKRHAPEAIAGKSEKEILALRTDPTIARKVFEGFTADNEKALNSAGLPVNDTTRYLAHWFGAGGAAELLKADPNKPISDFLPKGLSKTGRTWAAANGIEGKTVGQVIGIAEQRMGAPVGAKGEVKVASADPKAPLSDGSAPAKTGTIVDLIPMPQRIKMKNQVDDEWDRVQAAGRVEREAQETQAVTENLFSKYGYTPEGEAKGLAEARAKYTGKALNSVVTAFSGRVAEARRIEGARRDDAFHSALEDVWAGRPISPQKQADLERSGQWDKIGAEIVAFQSGNQKITNWPWMHENYLSKSPAEQAKVPLATLKEYTSRAEYEKIYKARKELAEDDPDQRSVSTYYAERVKPLGLDSKKEKDAAKLDGIQRELTARVDALQKKNGRKATSMEQKKIIDELFGKVALERSGFFARDIDAPLFKLTDPTSTEAKRVAGDTGVPVDQLPAVIRAMNERGLPLSIDNIKRAWEDGTQ